MSSIYSRILRNSSANLKRMLIAVLLGGKGRRHSGQAQHQRQQQGENPARGMIFDAQGQSSCTLKYKGKRKTPLGLVGTNSAILASGQIVPKLVPLRCASSPHKIKILWGPPFAQRALQFGGLLRRFLFRGLLFFPLVQQSQDLLFHLARRLVLPEILVQFACSDDHLTYLLFFFT